MTPTPDSSPRTDTAGPPTDRLFDNRQRRRARRRLIDWTSWILTLAALGGLTARLALGRVETSSLIAVTVFAVACLTVPWIARRASSLDPAAQLLVSLVFLMLVTIGYLAGGLSAPVLALLPVVPAVAMPLLGSRRAWIATALVAMALVGFSYLELSGHSFPSPRSDEGRPLARALMLLLTSLLVTGMLMLYERQNRYLRRRLTRQASRDPLTNLANRRQFTSVLEHEWRRAGRDETPLSVILYDIDHFKRYNDSFGHQAGDQCLKEVADVSLIAVRRSSDLVARYGGEEFIAILPATGYSDALHVGEALRSSVEQLGIANPASEHRVITVSVGIATTVEPKTTTSEQLIQKADRALYKAKAAGRNQAIGWLQGTE